MPRRFKTATAMLQLCGLLNVDHRRVLARLGYPPDYAEREKQGVTAAQYFEGWSAVTAEAARNDLPLVLGQAYARAPLTPAYFAFTCSPRVDVGFERLALFKPLVGPLMLTLRRATEGLTVMKSTTEPTLSLPLDFAATEVVFLVEAARACTGVHIIPKAVHLPDRPPAAEALEAYLGCAISIGPCSVTFRMADAARPLLSANPEHWAAVEPSFRQQLQLVTAATGWAERTRAALTQMLPSGRSSVADACDLLRLSSRSLQRHLRAEGTSFQRVLDDVRHDLAMSYLQTTALSIDEVSYLLGYRDPNSFYRAFQGWTGMTPSTARRISTRNPAPGSEPQV
ncbi:MAG: helix-turn-helix domain-containing protein [Pseudomonadota bacterium]